MSYKTVSIIGLGYIGLPTAAIMASRGLQVIGLDANQKTVDTINSGAVHIVEPDLDIVVRSTVTTGNLRATITATPADAFMIAVPTPFKNGHKPDLKYIKAVAKSIAPVLEKRNLVVLESTVPVGTTEKLSEWLGRERMDLCFPHQKGEEADIRIAHCPERVLPGHILQELVNNDRIIGGMTSRCSQAALELYKIFVKGECLLTSARTAELSKLAENAYRDVNIAFANELSLICDSLEINIWDLIDLANRHPRVNILQPGPGVGGHCIAVDPWFIVDSVPDKARLIRTAREINDSKPHFVMDKVRLHASKFKAPVIACLGLAFKPDIDDLRESPAMQIALQLAEEDIGTLLLVEPNIDEIPDLFDSFTNVRAADMNSALQDADIILGLVDHKQFKAVDHDLLHEKIVIDMRGMWR